uniref:Alternative protein LOC100129118 n=1 Tax=Homo sapiens TaxID=9606 RepID=L8EBI7_HUMAN|nr:alternative protein LOC100129118 [Homo sapiens]
MFLGQLYFSMQKNEVKLLLGAWKGDVAVASPASLCLPFSIFRVY